MLNAVLPNDRKGRSKADRRQDTANFFAYRERFNVALINPQYRVVGTTDIVWGHGRVVEKRKDGLRETRTDRFLTTRVKSGGKWLRLAFHLSAFPSGP